jgi:hypothetical protein
MLAITDGDAENRHILRNEFTAGSSRCAAISQSIRQDVQVGNLARARRCTQLRRAICGRERLRDEKPSIRT